MLVEHSTNYMYFQLIMHMSKIIWFSFLIALIPASLFAQEQDSIRLKEISTGVYANFESLSEKVLGRSTGYGVELGMYQERKLLGKVGLTYGAGFGYKTYTDSPILIDTTPNTDTTIIDYFFKAKHEDFKFSTAISFKFDYIDNPKVYILVGVGPEVTISQKVQPTYKETLYLGNIDPVTNVRPVFGRTFDDPPNYTEEDFKISPINFRFDIGFGIELKKFNIEIVNRTNNIQGIGIRVKYKFDTLIY